MKVIIHKVHNEIGMLEVVFFKKNILVITIILAITIGVVVKSGRLPTPPAAV